MAILLVMFIFVMALVFLHGFFVLVIGIDFGFFSYFITKTSQNVSRAVFETLVRVTIPLESSPLAIVSFLFSLVRL